MSPLKSGVAGLVALAACCAVAAPADAASDIYLKIEGIPGESASAPHGGGLQIESWSFGASQTASPRFGGGAGAGRTAMTGPASQEPPKGPGAMTVSKSYDASSAKLMQACAQGKHFPKATLTVRKAGGGQQEYMTYEMQDVLISSYSLGPSSGGGGGDSRPMESLSLNFTKIQYKTTPQSDDDAKSGAPGKAGYDVAPAKKI